jgi:hypothetical protein
MATNKVVPDSLPKKRGKEHWDQRLQPKPEPVEAEVPRDTEAPDDELIHSSDE